MSDDVDTKTTTVRASDDDGDVLATADGMNDGADVIIGRGRRRAHSGATATTLTSDALTASTFRSRRITLESVKSALPTTGTRESMARNRAAAFLNRDVGVGETEQQIMQQEEEVDEAIALPMAKRLPSGEEKAHLQLFLRKTQVGRSVGATKTTSQLVCSSADAVFMTQAVATYIHSVKATGWGLHRLFCARRAVSACLSPS